MTPSKVEHFQSWLYEFRLRNSMKQGNTQINRMTKAIVILSEDFRNVSASIEETAALLSVLDHD